MKRVPQLETRDRGLHTCSIKGGRVPKTNERKLHFRSFSDRRPKSKLFSIQNLCMCFCWSGSPVIHLKSRSIRLFIGHTGTHVESGGDAPMYLADPAVWCKSGWRICIERQCTRLLLESLLAACYCCKGMGHGAPLTQHLACVGCGEEIVREQTALEMSS